MNILSHVIELLPWFFVGYGLGAFIDRILKKWRGH